MSRRVVAVQKDKNRGELAQFLTTLNSLKHLDLHETGIYFFINLERKMNINQIKPFPHIIFMQKKASRLRCFIDTR